MKDFKFWKWYTETADKAGALVSYTIAGTMLGTTRQYIQNLVEREKLSRYEYDGMKFIGINDLQKIIIKRKEYLLNHPNKKQIIYNSARKEQEEEKQSYAQLLKELKPLTDVGLTEDQAMDVLGWRVVKNTDDPFKTELKNNEKEEAE